MPCAVSLPDSGEEFVRKGHMVVFCDINEELLAAAQATVEQKYPGARVFGIKCDVGMAEDVEKLAAFAKEKLGVVHYWVNNAGINGGRKPFVDLTARQIEAVVKVNMLGSLLCTSEALKLMKEQRGVKSHIFNTVGSGVKGGGTPGYAAYGATKRGLPQMTDSLVAELTKGVPGFEVEPPRGESLHAGQRSHRLLTRHLAHLLVAPRRELRARSHRGVGAPRERCGRI